MVESSVTKRQKIKQNLMEMASAMDGNFANFKVVAEDKELGNEARQTWEGDGPVTVIHYNAVGFTKEHWKTWV